MKLKVDDNGRFMVLVDSTQLEYDQLQLSFTKRHDDWYIVRKRNRFAKSEEKFVDQFGRIPLGLWSEVQKLAKKYHFPLVIEGIEHLYDKDFDESEFVEWVDNYFQNSEKKPRDYQIEAVVKILKYKNCVEEVATAGGKTMIGFMLFKYLLDKQQIKKMLYVVPRLNLVNQTEEQFYIYEEDCGVKPNWKSECVFGGNKKETEDINVIFGTYQSLVKKDINYFSKFDIVCIDESHHTIATSIKSIIVKTYNAKYKFGLTGTLPKEGSCDSFTVQAYLGPKVYEIKSEDLIAAKFATPVNVIGIQLDYLDEEVKKKLYNLRNVSADEKEGVKLLNLEKDLLRENKKRLKYVCETIAKSTKNSLVLFSDIKNEYGRTIYNWLRENTEKNVHYIDGGTKNENRDYFKKQIEEEENTIIVASVGVFGEGVNIINVHNIFIVESNKSEYIVRQILGRGMRLMKGKELMTVIDFCDDYEYGTHKYQKINYLMRHANERAKIYKDRGFPYKRFKVRL
jgi:superfamily II DNA or RNA helicase